MWYNRVFNKDNMQKYQRVICLVKPCEDFDIEVNGEYLSEYEICNLGNFGKCVMCHIYDINTYKYLGCGYSRDFINVAKMRNNKLNELLND